MCSLINGEPHAADTVITLFEQIFNKHANGAFTLPDTDTDTETDKL